MWVTVWRREKDRESERKEGGGGVSSYPKPGVVGGGGQEGSGKEAQHSREE